MKRWILLGVVVAAFVSYQQGWVQQGWQRFQAWRTAEDAPASTTRPVAALETAGVAPDMEAPSTPSVSQAPDRPPTGRLRVRCSACQGQGRYEFSGQGRMARTRPCPVCGAKGYRDITVPPRGAVCSACGGMGRKVEWLPDGRMRSSACQTCVGRGFVDRR